MATFPCTLEEFKAGVRDFVLAAPTCDQESLDNGLKAVTLMRLGITEEGPLVDLMADGAFSLARNAHSNRDSELFYERTFKEMDEIIARG